MVKSRSFSGLFADGLIALVLTALAVMTLAPLVHIVAVSLSDKAAVTGGAVSLWPVRPTVAPYEYILKDRKFFQAFAVAVERVVLGGAINFLITVLMAFALSREPSQFRARNAFMWIVVIALLFTPGLVPWYMTIRTLGIMDSIWALVLPTAVPLWGVIILMNFFRGVPKELEEAAVIDGAGPWTLLFQIYLPVSMPALATVTLFSLVNHWNSWFDGLILMNHPENYPLMTYIQQLAVVNVTDLKLVEKSLLGQISDQTLSAAKLVIAIIPILIVYPLLQRYFVRGITLGSIKE